jgi:hypothetical protein
MTFVLLQVCRSEKSVLPVYSGCLDLHAHFKDTQYKDGVCLYWMSPAGSWDVTTVTVTCTKHAVVCTVVALWKAWPEIYVCSANNVVFLFSNYSAPVLIQRIIYAVALFFKWAGVAQSVQRLATSLRCGDRIPVWARFSATVQTGHGVHPASCTMGTGSLLGVKSGWGVTLTPHPLLVPWSWKSRAIPLLLLWAVRPVLSLSACTRVTFIFTYLCSLQSSPFNRFPYQSRGCF